MSNDVFGSIGWILTFVFGILSLIAEGRRIAVWADIVMLRARLRKWMKETADGQRLSIVMRDIANDLHTAMEDEKFNTLAGLFLPSVTVTGSRHYDEYLREARHENGRRADALKRVKEALRAGQEGEGHHGQK